MPGRNNEEELLKVSIGVTNAHNASLIPSDKNDYFLFGGLTGHAQIGRTGIEHCTDDEQLSSLITSHLVRLCFFIFFFCSLKN